MKKKNTLVAYQRGPEIRIEVKCTTVERADKIMALIERLSVELLRSDLEDEWTS